MLSTRVEESTTYELVATSVAGTARETRRIDLGNAFVVHVITGDLDAPTPLENAHVRVEATGRAAGPFFEAMTDANGDATLFVDPQAFPVDVTVARTGFGAVSIVGLDAAPAEPINLSAPLTPPTQFGMISGTISGKQSNANMVTLDADLFITNETTNPSYTTQYLFGPGTASIPLRVVAVESQNGVAVNFAMSAPKPRDGMPQQADIVMPSPPISPLVTTVNVTLPNSGVFPGAPGGLGAMTQEVLEVHDPTGVVYSYVGISRLVVPSALSWEWTVQSYSTGQGEVIGRLAGDDGAFRLVAQLHRLGGAQSVSIGELRSIALPAPGSELLDMRIGVDAPSYHALAVNIGEDASPRSPSWRILFPSHNGPVTGGRIPRLPSNVTLAGLGLTPGAQTSVGFLLIAMDRSEPWTQPGVFQVTRDVAYQLGTQYMTFGIRGL